MAHMPLTVGVDADAWKLGSASPGEPVVELAQLGGEELEIPTRFTLDYTPEGSEPAWRMEFGVVDGTPQCRRLVIEATGDGREIRSRDLRSLQVEDLLELAATNVAWRREGKGRKVRMRREITDLTSGASRKAVQRTRRASRRKVTDEVLREVAEIYRANVDDRPTEAVRRHLGLGTDRAARLYVRRARDAGFLGESLRGKAGER